MSKDPLDLPVRRGRPPVVPHTSSVPENHSIFTEHQLNNLLDSGLKVVDGVGLIANGIMEIAHIRAQSAADVANIEARGEAMVKVLRAEMEKMMVNRKTIRTKGEAAACVIEQVMKYIPDADFAARSQALGMLPQMVRDVVASIDVEQRRLS